MTPEEIADDRIDIELADAVCAELRSYHDWPLAFEPRRLYVPDYDYKALAVSAGVKVQVISGGSSEEIANRDTQLGEHEVLIFVVRKLDGVLPADVDPLVRLVRRVKKFLAFRELAGFTDASWVRTENQPLYNPDALFDTSLFISIISLFYKVLE